MEKEMINVNDIAYAVKRDGSVINNFGDADDKDEVSVFKAFEPICFAPHNILKAIDDKKGRRSKEFIFALLGMLKYYDVSRKALNEYLMGMIGLVKKQRRSE